MAKDDEKPRSITIDVDTLNELIEAKVKSGIAEVRAKQTVDPDDFAEIMKKVRGGDKPPAPVRYEECESPLTGARFRAKVMASRSALGRVIDLEDYRWPEGIDVPQSQGGKMPDDHISAPDKHAHWKYWDFFRRDFNEYGFGKPFTRYILVTEADKRREMEKA